VDVPLQSAFLPSSNHSSTATDEDEESSGNVHSCSESPSTCDDSILESITLEEPFISCGLDAADVLEEDVDFAWFSAFSGLSKEAFDRLLYVLHTFLLPSGNKLPPFVPVDEYDCCVNDCVLFRDSASGTYSKMAVCPKCGEERFEPHSKIARKKFKYILIRPRLRRMFGDKTMSKHLQSHKHTNATSSDTDTIMSDLHQSPAWISKYDDNGPFQGDHRGVSLALCTDGMNPFSEHSTTYSIRPITLSILNLPRHVCHLPGSILLAGIIPGRSEPQNKRDQGAEMINPTNPQLLLAWQATLIFRWGLSLLRPCSCHITSARMSRRL